MKLPPSKYRGVVRQHNGKWGVLAYKDGQHIWLGSFWTEVAAAEAYDIAAQCLHGCYAKTNFKPLSKSDSASEAELHFLHSHTATEIVNMIRSHTYHAEFVRSMHDILIQQKRSSNNGSTVLRQEAQPAARQLLFHKVLSRSDTGQHNRLVIPKQQAMKHLFSGASSREGCMIDLEDEAGKIWSFRYTFWTGNRVHVLNRGWNEFVVAKGLRHGDMIRIWRHTDELGSEHLCIECDTSRSAAVAQVVHQSHHNMNRIVRLFGANINTDSYNNNNN